MTYIKDLIDLPEHVRRGDYVLKLSEGVTHPSETVRQYVVTPQLEKCFDEALTVIRSAVEGGRSRAAYLKGSFGSGKSHFMAVLCLILQGDREARAIPELARVVAKHAAWTDGKKFLLVPIHFMGDGSVESKILGGYVDHVRLLRPEAPTPGVFVADTIFRDARNLRETMGDELFFSRLNQSAPNPADEAMPGWGDIKPEWDAARFEAVLAAPPADEDRGALVGRLADTFFSAMRGAGRFTDIDTGLSLVSRHAKSLGYDAVIFLLDELILWLASMAGDMNRINREGQKLVKLVEAQAADRPVPVVSFIARQRDLRNLVADQYTGQEKLRFTDILDYWEARFENISLEDRNLPAIVEKRLLAPKNEAARLEIDEAFRKTASVRREVMDVLLTSRGDRDEFRKTYPFSPALVETLVELSFLLQRERTALKVMLQLLVEQRDTLKLGDLVPVGDVFEAVSQGDEVFHDKIKTDFENARRLYERKFRPFLEHRHGVRFDELDALPPDDPRVSGIRTDDRLVKTLLVAALAPNVESFQSLTPARLAALNHGTIKTPIPGGEATVVLKKCREWAKEIGELKIGDQPHQPVVSLQLTGVDTDGILAQVEGEDNRGNRIRKIKELFFTQAGIKDGDQALPGFVQHSFIWRGTKRSCSVLLENVRDLMDETLQSSSDDWLVVIDYPFDEDDHTPREDIERLERFRRAHPRGSKTIAWLPVFLSVESRRDLALLVKIDFLLSGERFQNYAGHLSPADRVAARSILENRQSQLKQKLISTLEGVYGIAKRERGTFDPASDLALSEQFSTLEPGLTLQPPVAPTLAAGLAGLLDQALSRQYPAHPHFDDDTAFTPTVLNRVFQQLENAIKEPDGRIAVDKNLRQELRRVVNPLKIAEMTTETHMVLGVHWKNHFLRREALHGGPLTVAKLKGWIDEPHPMGLPDPACNLIVHFFARQNNYGFYQYGSLVVPPLDKLSGDIELRPEILPSEEEWTRALARAEALFGVKCSTLLNSTNHATLVRGVKEFAHDKKSAVADLRKRIAEACATLKLTDSARLRTAASLAALLDALDKADDKKIVETLAAAAIETSEAEARLVLDKLSDLKRGLDGLQWYIFEGVSRLEDERGPTARGLLEQLSEAFAADERVVALAGRVEDVQRKAVKLLTSASRPPEPPPVEPKPVEPPPAVVRPVVAEASARPAPPALRAPASVPDASGTVECADAEDVVRLAETLRKRLRTGDGVRLRVTWEVIG